MNAPYTFKWKSGFFWRSKTVIGHHFEKEQNKMVLYFPNGSLREIKNWSNCEAALGTDWVLAVKKSHESQIGQPITLAVG